MKLICIFIKHDWEQIEAERLCQFREFIKAQIENREPFSIEVSSTSWVYKKVCLRCGKYIDTMTPEIERIKKEYDSFQRRKEQAVKLYKDMGEMK